MANIREYGDEGTLLVSSDLHGNLEDFLRMKTLFEHEENSRILFLGDLIHGVPLPKKRWREEFGDFYEDESERLLQEFFELQDKYPGRVDSLFGNHEHGHAGGPPVGRGARPESQTIQLHFELMESMPNYQERLKQFPIMALTTCGVAFTHASPFFLKKFTLDEIKEMQYNGYERITVEEMTQVHPLGRFLWPRSAGSAFVQCFLDWISTPERELNVSVCGHDPVREGYEKKQPNQICLSTSYMMNRANKFYLRLDMRKQYESVDDLKEGEELLRLYPDS